MLRQALAEVRHHPGRFVSTILAVAISVAFLAGSAVMVATEAGSEGRALNVPIAGADLVVDNAGVGTSAKLAGFAGVIAAAPVLQLTEPVTVGTRSEIVSLYGVPPEPLRWSKLVAGHWPDQADEIALSRGTAERLAVALNSRVEGASSPLTLVGLTDEPSTLFVKTGYAATSRFQQAGMDPATAGRWVVKLAPGADARTLAADLQSSLRTGDSAVIVAVAEDVRQASIKELAGQFEIFTNLLWAFAAVAMVVGMITIANTFSITLAQRRRQIGLLRAVGASGVQVRRRFLAEAVILGLVGSALGLGAGIGLAAAGSAYTGALFWGIALPWPQLAIAFAVGVLATLAAAWLPILRGTRVLPLEALQPVPAADEQRRSSTLRAVVCGLLLLAGAGLAVFAVSGNRLGFFAAVAAGALIALGVLFGAPLFVPGLLRLTGRLVKRWGTVAALAARNAERNPRRATATATALMLAVGLIVTLQVATASTRLTMLDEIERRNPVDVAVSWFGTDGAPAPVPEAVSSRLGMAPGVTGSVLLSAVTAEVTDDSGTYDRSVIGNDPSMTVVTGVATTVRDDQILLDRFSAASAGRTLTLKAGRERIALSVVVSPMAGQGGAIVSKATLARLGTAVPGAVQWLSVPDRSRAVDTMVAVTKAVGNEGQVSGSIMEAATIQQVLDILLAITTALLGVAVLIALIGVSNTLGLSVLERTRESALLRALGLQARSLRGMLTIEALQVTLVGVLVGLVAGAFFGWLAVTSLGRTSQVGEIRFAVDVPQTLSMLGLAVIAAALASVLPGRRAAKAAPTEALADI
jgi:putative ABC transport system permease protein